MISWGQPGPDPAADLEKLATELDTGDYTVALFPWGSLPHLHVTCRGAQRTVYSVSQYFWWEPYCDPIAPSAEVAEAARAVRTALATAAGDTK